MTAAATGATAPQSRRTVPLGAESSDGARSADTASGAGEAALDRHRRGLEAAAAGRPAAAAGHFRAGLRLLEPGPPPGTEAVTARLLTSLAHAEAELGRVERGLDLLDRAEPLGGDDYRAVVVSQRGLLLWRAGRYQAAQLCLDEAVPLLADHPDQVVLARVLLNRGGLHMGALRLAAARADLRRCEQIATACGAELLAAKAVHNRGYCELLAGDIPAALAAFETAEAGYREHGPGILPIAAVDRSRALLAAGLADEAAAGLESAIAAFRDQRLSQDRAEAELALAQALTAAGKPAEAAVRARQAQRHFQARGNETWAALSELTRARADFAALTEGDRDIPATTTAVTQMSAPAPMSVSRFVPRATRLADRLSELGLPHDAAFARLLAARALIRLGHRDTEIRPLIQAARPRGGVVPLELRLSAHLARAEFAASRDERAAALAELRTGLSHLHEQRRALGSLDLQTGTAALGRELTRTGLRLALAGGSVRSIFAWSERSRAQAFRLRPVRPPHDPGTAAALAEFRRLDEILRTTELAGRSDPPARQRHAALQRQLREQSWKISGLTQESAHSPAGTRTVAGGEAPTTLAATVAALDGAGHAMVSLLRQQDRLLALAIADGRAGLVTLGGYHRALEAAYRLQGDLDARVARRLPARLQAVIDASIRRQLDVLTSEITAPLRTVLGNLPVVVVPTGPLAAVPWSLLPDLRGRPVTVCPSAELWLTARRARCASTGRIQGQGQSPHAHDSDPDPDPRTVLAAGPRLAHAEQEVRAIAGLYPDPVVLTGRAATVSATLQAMDGARTVHLAAHGHHERGNVMFARIDLADGPLMAYDLQRLSKPPQCVILSACEVGRAEVRSGDEHLGFTAALLYAGTSTVISSGTAVPDASAPPLMAALHAALAAGTDPASALAEAMAPDWTAPFVCFGAG
ncbi:MAG: CHAT domain-containing protein [Actinocrinis sp.]